MSLDGVVQGPVPESNYEHAGWLMPYLDPDLGQLIGESITGGDALMGRVTYKWFESSFFAQSGRIGEVMGQQHKYVVSTTLKKAAWNNSTLLSGNILQDIRGLKQQPGKDIIISGSITLAQTLMEHNLIDEFSLATYPVVLGSGKRLFKDGTAKMTLQLIEAKPISNGGVLLRYQPYRNE